MQPEYAMWSGSGSWERLCLENVLTLLVYWALAHLTFLVFRDLGVLPMPVWPPAAVAIVMAFYRGWKIAPSLAVGTILANHVSLSSPLGYAFSLALMNTAGPILGASIIRRQVSPRLAIGNLVDLLICFCAIMIVPPVLIATGGIGFKFFFGLIPASGIVVGWLKWTIAHSLGALLFATPVFAWMALKEPRE
jgi:integral membrane sensor domain MASE1